MLRLLRLMLRLDHGQMDRMMKNIMRQFTLSVVLSQ